jgi:Family of unknown function (DUF6526)
MAAQTYTSHRRFIPLYHFVALPILIINAIVQIVVAVRWFSWMAVWSVIVAIALAALAWEVRGMATRAQDRIIRLEETLRLQRVLPADLRSRVGELTTSQLIGLRFSDDTEVPELFRAVLSGELKGREDIKRRITKWRPDTLRV